MELEDISLVRVGDVISRHFGKIEIKASRYTPADGSTLMHATSRPDHTARPAP